MATKLIYTTRKKHIEASSDFKNFIAEHKLETDTTPDGEIVLLTRQNADIVEKLIASDDNYFPFSRELFNYYKLPKIKNPNDKALFAVLREIDRDNSTNVWRYGQNRDSLYAVCNYIHDPKNKFFGKLKAGYRSLPDDIAKCGKGLKSFSSKVCKYLCEFAYGKDNYYINDSVVRRVLLFYLDYYKVDHSKINSILKVDDPYVDLFDLLEKLRNKANTKHGGKITRSELDHILWYCYKI